ncbi:MAG TPA: carboxypeptidase-like regulatory domain-containing protein [Longimicrobium sp.]|nr:carboxypeptidase-like regulatory domain-containing protein [Longimicrobium sp.]
MRRTSLFLCLLSLCAAQPLASQVQIDGIVVDDATGEPIPGARVRVYDGFAGWRRRSTDSIGNFSVTLRKLGSHRVDVHSPGYPDVSGTVVTGAFPYQNIEVRMRRSTQVMLPVTILARSQLIPPPHMQGFHDRLRNRRGAYVTREDVAAVRPGYISDMIAQTPGVLVRRTGRYEENRYLYAHRFADGSRTEIVECPLRVLVDAQVVNGRSPSGELQAVTVDYTVDQTMVDGIEIYVDPATVPPEFRGEGAQCGAVVIWTRNRPPQTTTAALEAGT